MTLIVKLKDGQILTYTFSYWDDFALDHYEEDVICVYATDKHERIKFPVELLTSFEILT